MLLNQTHSDNRLMQLTQKSSMELKESVKLPQKQLLSSSHFCLHDATLQQTYFVFKHWRLWQAHGATHYKFNHRFQSQLKQSVRLVTAFSEQHFHRSIRNLSSVWVFWSIFSRQVEPRHPLALLSGLEPFPQMCEPALVKQKVTIRFQCLLVNIFKALGNSVPRWGTWLSQSCSTWMCFLLADDLRGKCVFVQTSPLARALFVSLRRPFNSCCSDIIIKQRWYAKS